MNSSDAYRAFQISETHPDDFRFLDAAKEANLLAKEQAAEILSNTRYFYFIDKYGTQWEFEQGHTDIGD